MTDIEYNSHTLQKQVKSITNRYLSDMSGFGDTGIHQAIMECVEASIIETVIEHTSGNQKEAATISGINRNTLRNKLTKYNINIHKK